MQQGSVGRLADLSATPCMLGSQGGSHDEGPSPPAFPLASCVRPGRHHELLSGKGRKHPRPARLTFRQLWALWWAWRRPGGSSEPAWVSCEAPQGQGGPLHRGRSGNGPEALRLPPQDIPLRRPASDPGLQLHPAGLRTIAGSPLTLCSTPTPAHPSAHKVPPAFGLVWRWHGWGPSRVCPFVIEGVASRSVLGVSVKSRPWWTVTRTVSPRSIRPSGACSPGARCGPARDPCQESRGSGALCRPRGQLCLLSARAHRQATSGSRSFGSQLWERGLPGLPQHRSTKLLCLTGSLVSYLED